MSAPRHAFDCWRDIAIQIRGARRVALLTDFDGTLVRIRKNPDKVLLTPRIRRLLTRIADSGVTVGVVSGRSVADVRKRVGVDGIWYVGAHGFFLQTPGNHRIALLTPKKRAQIRSVTRVLARRLRSVAGMRLENKEATVALHYRGAPARSEAIARRIIADLLRRWPKFCLLAGKKVWELLPDSRTDKSTAIAFILRHERNRHPGMRWLVIYLGDDTTDERVFEKMRGISIAVGKKRRTAARFYLRSPEEVGWFLERLKEMAE